MSLDLERIKGLCFDVDGTLSDTDDAWVERITRILAPQSGLLSPHEARHFGRWLVMATESPMNTLYYWMDALSLDDNFARLYEKLAQKNVKNRKRFTIMDGARELLDRARVQYPLTVVSARDELTTSRFLDQFELTKHFIEIVTSQTCDHTKPYPQPVVHAARRMGLEPQECLMIGDTTVDVLAGKRAGAQTVGLLCGFGTERELRRAGADVILDNLPQLANLLKLD